MSATPTNIPELVPFFPLPEAVLFPRQVLPLHIFEPRYCAMVADALSDAGLVAIALLKPGYERLYFTSRAPVHQLLGVGRIIASEELEEGKYNILLRGETRAEIVTEFPGRPYRQARVEPIPPRCDCSPDTRRQLRQGLFEAIRRHLATDADCRKYYEHLFKAPLSLGEVADVIAGALPVVGELGQCLLAEPESSARARCLLEQLDTLQSVVRCVACTEQQTEWDRN